MSSSTLKSTMMVHNYFVVLALIAISAVPLVVSHVALTYPPARQYDLDFLDNSRTKGPCGMPRGESIKMLLISDTNPSRSLPLLNCKLTGENYEWNENVWRTTSHTTRSFNLFRCEWAAFFFCNINIKIWHSNEFLHIADYDGRDVASNAPNLVILLPMIFFVGLRLLK